MLTPHLDDGDIRVYHADCIDAMRQLPADSVDAIVTDPPYGLEFMGKEWDSFRGSNSGIKKPSKKAAGIGTNGAPVFSPNRRNQKCPECGKWAYDHAGRKCECGGWKQPAQVAYSNAFQSWCEAWAREALRIAKPGAHLAAFGGPRTFHRLTAGIEDAGWEIRDSLAWMYGSGFPKSLDVAKAIDKRRDDDPRPVCRYLRAAIDASDETTATIGARFGFNRRMVEHWAARDTDSQPTVPTLAQWAQLREMLPTLGSEMDGEVARLNARKGDFGEAWHAREVIGERSTGIGTGNGPVAIIGDGDRRITAPATPAAAEWAGWGTALKPAYEPIILARKPLRGTVAANVLAHGTGALNIDATRIDGTKAQRGERRTALGRVNDDGWKPKPVRADDASGRWPANVVLDPEAAKLLDEQTGDLPAGVAVRHRGVPSNGVTGWGAKAPGTPDVGYGDSGGASRFFYTAKADAEERVAPDGTRNTHPTVKPADLMRWLVRLVTPPGGTVLDPFAGSGSTGVACRAEHVRAILIERDAEYARIIASRLAQLSLFSGGDS